MEEVDVFENGTEATGIMDMKLDKVEAVSRNALLVSTDSLLMSGNVLASFGVPFFANMATALLQGLGNDDENGSLQNVYKTCRKIIQ